MDYRNVVSSYAFLKFLLTGITLSFWLPVAPALDCTVFDFQLGIKSIVAYRCPVRVGLLRIIIISSTLVYMGKAGGE